MRVLAEDLTFPERWGGGCVIGGRPHQHDNLARCHKLGHRISRYTDDEPDALPRFRHNDDPDEVLVLDGGAWARADAYCEPLDEWVGAVHQAERAG